MREMRKYKYKKKDIDRTTRMDIM